MIASTQTNPLSNVKTPVKTVSPLDVACARLKSAGLRITQPRIAILEALIKRSLPASIEQIHNDLPGTACDLVTVYRCLAAFEELGLVRRCFFHNGTSLYQINLGEEAAYHVVNKTDNTVEALDAETAAELRAALKKVEDKLKARGFTEVTHMVEFFGTPAKPASGRATNATVSNYS